MISKLNFSIPSASTLGCISAGFGAFGFYKYLSRTPDPAVLASSKKTHNHSYGKLTKYATTLRLSCALSTISAVGAMIRIAFETKSPITKLTAVAGLGATAAIASITKWCLSNDQLYYADLLKLEYPPSYLLEPVIEFLTDIKEFIKDSISK